MTNIVHTEYLTESVIDYVTSEEGFVTLPIDMPHKVYLCRTTNSLSTNNCKVLMKYLILLLLLVITSCAPRMVAQDRGYVEIHTTEDIYYVYLDRLYITSESDKYYKYKTYDEMMLAVADITAKDAVTNWENNK